MDVFKNVEEVDIQGHKLTIHLGTFIESERLFSEVVKCYKDKIGDIALLSVETVKIALLPCLQKCFFDNQPIKDWSFFEDIQMRGFYVAICMKVIDVNTAPFMTSPL